MRRLLLVSAPLLLAAVLAAPQAAEACGDSKAAAHCPMKAEGADVEVTELDDGVQITITSADAETVQRVQEHARAMSAKQDGEGCAHQKKAEAHGDRGCEHHAEQHAGQ